jgi:hypothetical protein
MGGKYYIKNYVLIYFSGLIKTVIALYVAPNI